MTRSYREINHTGVKYGRLTALHKSQESTSTRNRWVFKCDCGNTVTKNASWVKSDLKKGYTPSCGCHKKENAGKHSVTHGMASSLLKNKEYRTWLSIKRRCSKPSQQYYYTYGGRGIYVSPEWLHSFETFISDMGSCPDGYSLERKDVNGPYSKENCCWIPLSKQGDNTTRSAYYLYKFEIYTQSNLARKLGMSQPSLSRRKTMPPFVTYLGKLNAMNK